MMRRDSPSEQPSICGSSRRALSAMRSASRRPCTSRTAWCEPATGFQHSNKLSSSAHQQFCQNCRSTHRFSDTRVPPAARVRSASSSNSPSMTPTATSGRVTSGPSRCSSCSIRTCCPPTLRAGAESEDAPPSLPAALISVWPRHPSGRLRAGARGVAGEPCAYHMHMPMCASHQGLRL